MGAEKFAALQDLLVDLLKYGAAAQTYREYNVEALVTAGLTEEQAALGSVYAASNNQTVKNNNANGVSFKGTTVYFDNTISVRFYFTVAEGTTVYAILNGEEATVRYDGSYGMYYVETAAISATAFDNAQTLLISANGSFANMLSVSYDVNTYAYNRAKKSTDETEVALVKALYAYGRSAEMLAAK